MNEGTWAKDDIRRAFVEGAKWWEYHSTKGTMWQSDQRLAEDEATRRYVSQPANTADTNQLCTIDHLSLLKSGYGRCGKCKEILRR